MSSNSSISSTPYWILTSDLFIRSELLCTTELRERLFLRSFKIYSYDILSRNINSTIFTSTIKFIINMKFTLNGYIIRTKFNSTCIYSIIIDYISLSIFFKRVSTEILSIGIPLHFQSLKNFFVIIYCIRVGYQIRTDE